MGKEILKYYKDNHYSRVRRVCYKNSVKRSALHIGVRGGGGVNSHSTPLEAILFTLYFTFLTPIYPPGENLFAHLWLYTTLSIPENKVCYTIVLY